MSLSNLHDMSAAHHFFGSTAFGWATGASTAEVLAKLARQAGADLIRRNVSQQGGLYAWTCRVEAPAGASYRIEFFEPQGVTVTAAREYLIQNVKGHVAPVDPEETT